MNDSEDGEREDAEPCEPTEEEVLQIRAASPAEFKAVEAMILRACSHRWQKVARIIGGLVPAFNRDHGHLPLAYVQAVMDKLEDLGKVEIEGDVWAMRHSEIRLLRPGSDAV